MAPLAPFYGSKWGTGNSCPPLGDETERFRSPVAFRKSHVNECLGAIVRSSDSHASTPTARALVRRMAFDLPSLHNERCGARRTTKTEERYTGQVFGQQRFAKWSRSSP